MTDADTIDFEPEVDRYWSERILFPRPSAMSDEAMDIAFWRLDGRWSPAVIAARRQFAAAGLELNENWALTPQSWTCPACGRDKPSVMRLSRRGVLLAKLDIHHDHAGDNLIRHYLGKDFDRRSLGPHGAGMFSWLKPLAIRFEPVIVCSDCNAADGAVKTRMRGEIDPRFSFTAGEIGQFVRARPNQPHEIDHGQARAIWLGQEPPHREREQRLRELHQGVRDGLFRHDHRGAGMTRIAYRSFETSHLLLMAFSSASRYTGCSSRLASLAGEFLARSTCRDLPPPPPAPRDRKPVLVPEAEELAGYVDRTSSVAWNATDDAWRCPVCDRTRRQAVRRGKSGRLTGGVGTIFGYVEAFELEEIRKRRSLFPFFENRRVIADMRSDHVCTDCRDIAVRLGQERPGLSRPWLSLDDLRSVVIDPVPHQPHEFDVDDAAARALANRSLEEAETEFRAMESLGHSCAQRLKRLREAAIPEPEAWSQITREFIDFDGLIDDDPVDMARWLVCRVKGPSWRP